MTIADKGARVGNFIIDSIIILFLIVIQALILGAVFTVLSEEAATFFTIYCLLFYSCYYLLFEYFFNKTPGKFLTKTMVVNYCGRKPNLKSHVMRSIARLIPYNHFSFLFGQGLHDSISNTIVVNVRKNKL